MGLGLPRFGNEGTFGDFGVGIIGGTTYSFVELFSMPWRGRAPLHDVRMKADHLGSRRAR